MSKLRHDHGCLSQCYKCCSPKPPLCAWVGDAAQLFEEISRDEVLRRLRLVFAELRDSSHQSFGVVTKKSRRLHYWVARNNFRPTPGAHLHRWEDMLTIAELALMQTCVNVGPVLFE